MRCEIKTLGRSEPEFVGLIKIEFVDADMVLPSY
jgi:hypothetical protein